MSHPCFVPSLAPQDMPFCVHCSTNLADCKPGTNRPTRRGLCSPCWRDDEIREQYTPKGTLDGLCRTDGCKGNPYRKDLCRHCYADMEKRAAAPARPVLGDDVPHINDVDFVPPMPAPVPDMLPPEERVRIYMERAGKGLAVVCPDDGWMRKIKPSEERP